MVSIGSPYRADDVLRERGSDYPGIQVFESFVSSVCDQTASKVEVSMAEQFRIERVEYVIGEGYRYRVRETDEGICEIQYQEEIDGGYVDEGKPFNTSFECIQVLLKAAQSVYGANRE